MPFRASCDEVRFEELSSFSLTVVIRDGELKRRIFSNFTRLIRLLRSRIRGKSGGIPGNQDSLDSF